MHIRLAPRSYQFRVFSNLSTNLSAAWVFSAIIAKDSVTLTIDIAYAILALVLALRLEKGIVER